MQKDRLPVITIRAPDHEKLNANLRDMLMGMSDTVPDRGSNQANQQSYFDKKWLSHSELYKSGDQNLQKLVGFVEETVNQRVHKPDPEMVLSIMSMWCIVSKPGLEGVRHNHSGRISGAYYVDTGSSGEKKGGLLQFYLDHQSDKPTHSFEPESGMLYLFPSTLQHSVSRYDGTSPRIVIALNLK